MHCSEAASSPPDASRAPSSTFTPSPPSLRPPPPRLSPYSLPLLPSPSPGCEPTILISGSSSLWSLPSSRSLANSAFEVSLRSRAANTHTHTESKALSSMLYACQDMWRMEAQGHGCYIGCYTGIQSPAALLAATRGDQPTVWVLTWQGSLAEGQSHRQN